MDTVRTGASCASSGDIGVIGQNGSLGGLRTIHILARSLFIVYKYLLKDVVRDTRYAPPLVASSVFVSPIRHTKIVGGMSGTEIIGHGLLTT